MSDPIQALLDAAANPKWREHGFETEIEEAKDCFIAAADKALRAVFEEWLRYGYHEAMCNVSLGVKVTEEGNCNCGWSARRQQIADYLERTNHETSQRG